MEPQTSTRKNNTVTDSSRPHKKIKTTITTVTTIVTEEIQDGTDESQLQSQQSTISNIDDKIVQEQLRLLKQQLESTKVVLPSKIQAQSIPAPSLSSIFPRLAVPHSQESTPINPSQNLPRRQVSNDNFSSQTTNSTVDVTNNQPILDNNILEKGVIYFFYRPRIGVEIASDMNDVQRFFILLQTFPDHNQKAFFRLLRIGKKKLPSLHEHNRFWGIVEEATDDINKIDAMLADQTYSTITRGERQLHSCIPVGEGVYALVLQNGFCHLAYVLENPTDLGDVQTAFNIEHQGSYIVSVKNPQMPNQPANTQTGVGLPLNPRPSSQQLPESPVKVQFPQQIQDVFQGRRFAPAVPKEMLNFKGAEIVVIGETNKNPILFSEEFRKIEQELGIESQHHLNETSLYDQLKLHRGYVVPTGTQQQ